MKYRMNITDKIDAAVKSNPKLIEIKDHRSIAMTDNFFLINTRKKIFIFDSKMNFVNKISRVYTHYINNNPYYLNKDVLFFNDMRYNLQDMSYVKNKAEKYSLNYTFQVKNKEYENRIFYINKNKLYEYLTDKVIEFPNKLKLSRASNFNYCTTDNQINLLLVDEEYNNYMFQYNIESQDKKIFKIESKTNGFGTVVDSEIIIGTSKRNESCNLYFLKDNELNDINIIPYIKDIQQLHSTKIIKSTDREIVCRINYYGVEKDYISINKITKEVNPINYFKSDVEYISPSNKCLYRIDKHLYCVSLNSIEEGLDEE